MSARPFITLKYSGQPEHAPSSTTAHKSDKLSKGDIKKQAIGDIKSPNMTEECNSDPKVMNPLSLTRQSEKGGSPNFLSENQFR
jgi:hypothetical protein